MRSIILRRPSKINPKVDIDPQRSAIMRAVPRSNSNPEIAVRKVLHRLGLRFRLHRKDLPGTPDIVLRRYKSVIFVHGCFWHRHIGCAKATTPKTHIQFWNDKFKKNTKRDAKNEETLRNMGWNILTIWECQVKDTDTLEKLLRSYFKI